MDYGVGHGVAAFPRKGQTCKTTTECAVKQYYLGKKDKERKNKRKKKGGPER